MLNSVSWILPFVLVDQSESQVRLLGRHSAKVSASETHNAACHHNRLGLGFSSPIHLSY
jgi:hypothetical protein